MCQCMFLNFNKCITLGRFVATQGRLLEGEEGQFRRNELSAHFCCKCETALKYEVYFKKTGE